MTFFQQLIGLSLLYSGSLIAQDCTFDFPSARLIVQSESLENQSKESFEREVKELDEQYGGKQLNVLKTSIEERHKYFEALLADGDLIINGDLYNYTQELLDKITQAMNVGHRTIFLIRDEWANAFNMGDNNIFVHIGLILRAKTEEELVFVLGHELGHNELGHFRQSLLDYSDLMVNDSIQKRMRQIKGSAYGQVSALNSLFTPWLLESKSKARTAELAADIYGYKCLIACGYDPTLALGTFEMLEESQEVYEAEPLDLKKVLLLDGTGKDFSYELKFRTGSSLGDFEEEEDTLKELLRTHPYGKERKVVFQTMLDSIRQETSPRQTDFVSYKSLAEREVIIDAVYSERIDRALFYAIYLQQRDSSDCFSRMIIPFCFAYLGYEKIHRRSGKIIDTQNPYYEEECNKLIYFLREISPEKCFAISRNWVNHDKDFLGTGISGPTLLILDVVDKNYDNFKIRYQTEMDRPGTYYLKRIIESIKLENKL